MTESDPRSNECDLPCFDSALVAHVWRASVKPERANSLRLRPPSSTRPHTLLTCFEGFERSSLFPSRRPTAWNLWPPLRQSTFGLRSPKKIQVASRTRLAGIWASSLPGETDRSWAYFRPQFETDLDER